MPHYRMYLLDAQGKFRDVHVIEAKDEAEAKQLAEALSQGQNWELWQESKMIDQSHPRNGA